jgi:hypothetical protein
MPIEKREIAPKTWELYNTDRDEPNVGPTPVTQAAQETYDSIRSGEMAGKMFEEAQQLERHRIKADIPFDQGARTVQDFLRQAHEAPPKQKREWRQQFRTFDQTLKKDPTSDNAISGIQELIDSGAMYMDDNGGVYWAIPNSNEGRNRRILDASREWGDWYRDQLAYGEDIGPNGRASVEMDNVIRMDRLKAVPEP